MEARCMKCRMTSSDGLKSVVSYYETTTNEVAPRKPFNINHSVLRDTKSLLYGSLNEYSVFGSPQQKIGNFTQTKIGGFS